VRHHIPLCLPSVPATHIETALHTELDTIHRRVLGKCKWPEERCRKKNTLIGI